MLFQVTHSLELVGVLLFCFKSTKYLFIFFKKLTYNVICFRGTGFIHQSGTCGF